MHQQWWNKPGKNIQKPISVGLLGGKFNQFKVKLHNDMLTVRPKHWLFSILPISKWNSTGKKQVGTCTSHAWEFNQSQTRGEIHATQNSAMLEISLYHENMTVAASMHFPSFSYDFLCIYSTEPVVPFHIFRAGHHQPGCILHLRRPWQVVVCLAESGEDKVKGWVSRGTQRTIHSL